MLLLNNTIRYNLFYKIVPRSTSYKKKKNTLPQRENTCSIISGKNKYVTRDSHYTRSFNLKKFCISRYLQVL